MSTVEMSFGSAMPQLRLLPQTDNVRAMQTIIHDKCAFLYYMLLMTRGTSNSDVEFHANRLIRLVVEEGLDHLPISDKTIITPTGEEFVGKKFTQGICGVTIMRAGAAMEHGLRECCKSIPIGHILIQHDASMSAPQVYYAKLPLDVKSRFVLLLNPIIVTGATIIKAVEVLQEHGVAEESVTVLNLFATPEGIKSIFAKFPKVQIVSSEVRESCCALEFESRYFGT